MADRIIFSVESWMTDLYPVIKGRKLTELFIPGSHDSAMTLSCLTKSGFMGWFGQATDLGPDAPDFLKKLSVVLNILRIDPRHKVRNWAVTQKLSLYEQLTAGVRYFDLRIANIDGVFKFTHGLQSNQDMFTMLQPVEQFMRKNPGEVLILHCQHFHDMNGEYDRLLAGFQSCFGNMLCSRNKINETEFETYIKTGKRILLVWDGGAAASLSNPNLVFDEATALKSEWKPDHMKNQEDLVKWLLDEQNNKRPTPDPKLSVIQGILDVGDIGAWTFETSDLLSYEENLNAYLTEHLLPHLSSKRGFIFMVDNVFHPHSEATTMIIRRHADLI